MLASLIRVSWGKNLPLSQSLKLAGRPFVSSSQIMQASSKDEEPIRYPVPPFTEETAKQKVKAAQVGSDASWNLLLIIGGPYARCYRRRCQHCVRVVPTRSPASDEHRVHASRMPGTQRIQRRYHLHTRQVNLLYRNQR